MKDKWEVKLWVILFFQIYESDFFSFSKNDGC